MQYSTPHLQARCSMWMPPLGQSQFRVWLSSCSMTDKHHDLMKERLEKSKSRVKPRSSAPRELVRGNKMTWFCSGRPLERPALFPMSHLRRRVSINMENQVLKTRSLLPTQSNIDSTCLRRKDEVSSSGVCKTPTPRIIRRLRPIRTARRVTFRQPWMPWTN